MCNHAEPFSVAFHVFLLALVPAIRAHTPASLLRLGWQMLPPCDMGQRLLEREECRKYEPGVEVHSGQEDQLDSMLKSKQFGQIAAVKEPCSDHVRAWTM